MGITPVAVLDVCVPSSVFLYNNIKKVENGEKARGTVVFAQGAKIAQAVAKYHDDTAKNATEAYNIFGKYASKSKVLDYAGKGINWATRNVNPLICASAVYKTLTSDDKVHTGITQVGALSGMFLGEGLMKLYSGKAINEENINKLAEQLKDTKGLGKIANYILKNALGGKIASILKGVAFVTVSMTSYNIGQKFMESTANRICTDLGINSDDKSKSSVIIEVEPHDNKQISDNESVEEVPPQNSTTPGNTDESEETPQEESLESEIKNLNRMV